MSDVKPPPMHEREEYIAMRDALARQLMKSPTLYTVDYAREVANKIAPVLYQAVEDRCLMFHMNTVQNAHGMLGALERIQQLDVVRLAAETWRNSITIKTLLDKDPKMLTPSERALVRAVDTYRETRTKKVN